MKKKSAKRKRKKAWRPPRQLYLGFYRDSGEPSGDISEHRSDLADLEDMDSGVKIHGPYVLAERTTNS